ncbi:uncharacterized protein PV07_08175 [Cladophialophora immunda]|uniref:NB-ARC domain-containing protein n=1 Tax=Cladophialophora immunda TaxID=569365 RepID=A0A0D1ZKM7_9EURO|nr:uncharacterized protein PV07_08175 [Cladophialophora immunda]KIW28516.1 hypothetical protein PV07_08175 [Cladophialophora immunda]OQU95119.1 Tetratricopeptide repeat-containing protein [Cladophialophora immunda]
MAGAPPTRRLKHSDYTVAIICPLEVEMSAVRYMLDQEHARLPKREGDPNSYIFGEMGGRNVVIGYLPEGFQGIGAATAVATHMQRSFLSAKLRLLVGIGGGIPSTIHDIRLGDVVIGMPESEHGGVVQYDLGKESITGFIRKGHLDKPPQEWMTAIVKMKSDHRVVDNKISTIVASSRGKSSGLDEVYTPPKPETDIRSPSNSRHSYLSGHNGCEKCEEKVPVLTSARASNEPAIFYGTIASGDRVVKSGKIRDRISKDIGGALCFEMEAAGLVNNFRCVVIRGIADYADAHKNDDWHPWAAATAAACAKELLGYMMPVDDSGKPKYSTIPKLRVKDFIGREQQISEIMAFFAAARSVDGCRILILSAMGGQGKSQIALEYCRRMQSVYQGLFWVDASSQSTTVRSLVRIAEVLDVSAAASRSDDENVQFVLDMAANCDGRWLVVFDNYDDPIGFPRVKDFIPEGTEILFTSRHKDLDRLGEVLSVPSLLPDEEARLLFRNFKNTDTQRYQPAAQQLVDRLGHLALAIDQAAAYIQYRRIKLEDLGDFVETFDKEREKILKYIPRDFWEYGSQETQNDIERKSLSAFTTWEMSFHQLCRENHAQEEDIAHFLTISAYLAPIPIDEWLFHNVWKVRTRGARRHPPRWMHLFNAETEGESNFESASRSAGEQTGTSECVGGVMEHSKKSDWDTTKFWDLIERAESLSLVQNASTDPELKMTKFTFHPLIRDWLQLRQQTEKRRGFTKETIRLVGDSIRTIRRENNVVTNIKQTLVLHMDASLQNDAVFSGEGRRLGQEDNGQDGADLFAWLYNEQGRYDSSFELLNVVRQTREVQLGPAHKKTLIVIFSQGTVLLQQSKYSAAERLSRNLLATQQGVLGPEHRDVLKTRHMLADSLSGQDKPQEAEALLREVLTVYQTLLDEQSWERLSAMNSLALSLRRQHKLEEAEEVFQEVYQIRQRVLDPDDVDMMMTKFNLALTVSERGRTQEARQMLEEVLEALIRVLGPTHPDALHIRTHLASVLKRQGKNAEAEGMCRDVLEIQERVLGKDYRATLWTANELAVMAYDQGRLDEAEPIFRDVLERQTRVFGPGHRDTLITMGSLGCLLMDRSCFVEAYDLLDKALPGFARAFGPDHKDTVYFRRRYERLLELMGRQGHPDQQPSSRSWTCSRAEGSARVDSRVPFQPCPLAPESLVNASRAG